MNSQKKILMLIGLFHPFVGGAERECQNVSRKLIEMGHTVTVLTEYRDGLQPFEVIDGIPVYRKIRGWHFFEFTYILSVFMLLWKHRKSFDTILCFGMYLYAVPAVLFGFCSGKKVLLRLECGGAYGDFQRMAPLKFRKLIIWSSKRAHRILAISSEIEHELLLHGFPQKKIQRISNSVDIRRFAPCDYQKEKTMPVISCIGRLEKQKGIDLLLNALKIISDRGVAYAACIVGDGPQRAELVGRVHQLGLSDTVTFAGLQQDVAPYFRKTDILVMPSRFEGLPLVLLEAMASGLAIVATSVGGMPDVLDPQHVRNSRDDYAVCESGILVPPENPELLAEAIQALLRSPDLRKSLGANARQNIIRTYALDRVIQNYLAILN
ncbi:MAG: glycosyltransferase family 4 protein [Deltaproteobacteria bacterium]|nr:glycosyltransferase family 4 protein [Deltaproteobacteria bacterium]